MREKQNIEYKYDSTGVVVEMRARKVETPADKLGDKWSDRWSDRWSEQLSKRQIKILKLILVNPKISREKLSEILGINPSAIQKHIGVLKKLDVIKRSGSAKSGYWKVLGKRVQVKAKGK